MAESETVDKRPNDRAAGPSVFVIMGAAGDLTKRKLIPALYNLAKNKLLPTNFAVVGIARRDWSHEEFRKLLTEAIEEFATTKVDKKIWSWLQERIFFHGGDFDNPKMYQGLSKLLEQIDKDCGTAGNYLYYLATPPHSFGTVVMNLGEAKLTIEEKNKWRRVIIEKPFGYDLQSAKELNQQIGEVLDEKQVYRIDHYLGKETVQNILFFRFGNGIFEPIWNRRYVDHVQITVSETLGIEGRGGYYEESGALRDMLQNHLFQLLAFMAMEPPPSFDADALRDEKVKALRAIQPLTPEEVLTETVRGQYDAGSVNGIRNPAYRNEERVAADSPVETFVAAKLYIDNWRWAGVPFYLRTGKCLAKRVTEICIQFKQAPFLLFRNTPIKELLPSRLVLRIQPDEGIYLEFGVKVPGPIIKMSPVEMEFCYDKYFGTTPSTGYETLLYDCMMGDATLFQRADNVEAGWSVVAPILDLWKALPPRTFPNYKPGSWGPKESDELMQRDGRTWHV